MVRLVLVLTLLLTFTVLSELTNFQDTFEVLIYQFYTCQNNREIYFQENEVERRGNFSKFDEISLKL